MLVLLCVRLDLPQPSLILFLEWCVVKKKKKKKKKKFTEIRFMGRLIFKFQIWSEKCQILVELDGVCVYICQRLRAGCGCYDKP